MEHSIHFINGIATAIYDSAPEQGDTAVVFIHGNPGPMDDWQQLIETLRPSQRCIAMDLPGFGRSARPVDFKYDIPGYVAFFDHLVHYLGLRQVHLVLHDFGGAFGLWWANANASMVASITLLNTGVLPGYHWHSFARIWQTPIVGELFSLVSFSAVTQRALNQANPRPLPKPFLRSCTRFADWPNKKAVLKLYRACRDPEPWFGAPAIEQLRQHRFNVCVIWGEEDPFLPVKFATEQAMAFPDCAIHRIANSGHWPFIDEPKLVAALVKRFLAEQLKPNDSRRQESNQPELSN